MGTTSNRDYYADLELGQGAEEAEIKRAYRKLGMHKMCSLLDHG